MPARSTPTTTDEEAALYDAHVVPRFSSLFGGMILSAVGDRAGGQILDIGCGTGHPAFELLRRIPDGSGRLIAIDRDQALLDLARRRGLDQEGSRIFFKVQTAEKLGFGDQVFDMVVGNLVLGSVRDPAQMLGELRRVLVPDGTVLLTRALAGTFVEVLDAFSEIAFKRDLPGVAERVRDVRSRYPDPGPLASFARSAGFDSVEVELETFRLPFRKASDLMSDPMLRFVAVPEWRWIAGFEDGSDKLLAEVERTLDIYFGGGPLSLTIEAGLLRAAKPPG